jgi:undecaprenyl-diphosphatase
VTPFDAAILGVVEGVTEFLPISSTGHLILASHLLGLPQTEFLKTFDIAIQLGAILAVGVLYWRSFLRLEVLKKVVVGFIPTGVIGFALYSFVKARLLDSELLVLVALFAGGVALIAFEYWHTERDGAASDVAQISYRQALGVGVFQALAIVPGVSRSAATILGGLLLGLKRTTIIEYSFLLAVPTMGAATALDMYKNYATISAADLNVLAVGFVVAFIVALAVIRWFLSYVRTRTFVPFGIYRIVVAVLFFLIFMPF